LQIVNLPLEQLKPAPWNSNQMDNRTLARLKESIQKYGIVTNLVVRRLADSSYEVLSGNQRLKLLNELGYSQVLCSVLDLDDGKARLLAQALNHLHGEDDLGLRAELMQDVLKTIPEADVLAILPETAVSLKSLNTLGQMDIAAYLGKWQQALSTRLKTMQFKLTHSQEEMVEEALSQLLLEAKQKRGDSPNTRGTALYLLCKKYLERRENHGS
jgi:ParB family chromosome partitioning protein